MRLGMGRAARGRVGRPPGCPRPSSASVEEAPGRAMVGTAASRMSHSGDGSQSISVFRKVMLTEWAGAAGPAASTFSPSPAAPAGWGQLQLDQPLGSQSGTLGPRHNLGQARWHPRCSLQLSPSSTISPSSPATSPFLRSHLLPSSCSGVARLLASTLTASQLRLLTTSTKGIPLTGAEQLQGQTRAITLKGKHRRQHRHGSSSSVMVGHQGGPCPGSRDDAAGWAASDWQQCCCSRKKLLLGLGGLWVHSTGRDGAGPSPPSWRAALTPPSQHSHLHRPRYHPIPPRPPEHRAPALVQGLPGCNTFIQCRLYSVSPSVSLRLETPAQPSSPRRCPQWGSAARAEPGASRPA